MHRLVTHTMMSNIRGYVVNLDPAVMTLPFVANIDIRDTVQYKEVMNQFNLGPNGGILTSLNLFATKFNEMHLQTEVLRFQRCFCKLRSCTMRIKMQSTSSIIYEGSSSKSDAAMVAQARAMQPSRVLMQNNLSVQQPQNLQGNKCYFVINQCPFNH